MAELTPEEKQKIYEEEKARVAAQAKIKQENQKKGCLGCLGIFAVIFVISLLISVLSPAPKEAPANPKEDAYTAAITLAPQALKSPDSATFPYYDKSMDSGIVDIGGGQWQITSFVDAENSFGAKIRTDYTAIVSHVNDKWRLVSFEENQ